MELTDLLEALNAGTSISAGSPLHEVMHRASQEALRITVQLNSSYHEPARIIELMSELTGQQVDETFRLFPPFHTDFGKNITFGRRVFVNSCCRFQDQGGIRIGDDVLIGHSAMLATLNHDVDPDRRGDLHPSPIVIGDQVWLGANVTVLPGATIGDGAIIGAGSIVTSDIPARAIAVGSPARVVRLVDRATGER